ncbi:hypothetical protein [Flavobacterium sp. Root186]|uniref:PD-(D/E)XK nuclease domain-containing protein n=1 Tax=Flavobacterium sp. Root186 TaxID=1736485 RepID=UPI0006F9F194|nr:hypothetical protein [Flavobacterium sp. Root186]KRB54703.1 hypothetical protein ASD98_16820 [Flavobacterium sp. Root186]
MRNLIYQEKIINEKLNDLTYHLAQVENLNVKLDFCGEGEDYYIDKQIEQAYGLFNSSINELYLILINYFETQNSRELLTIFKTDLCHILDPAYNSILTLEDPDYGSIFYVSEDLNKIKKFLLPYEAFDEKVNKNIGLIYLENILSNTSCIIEELDRKPSSETIIYNSVKHVIKATFPNYMEPSEPFVKHSKCYRPDILIPSLNTAIEYKYATDENRLIKTIEEILIDVAGYSNHSIYKIFYAVFYVTPGICTEQRFRIIWDEQKFPKNWKSIYVIGK